MMSVPSAGMRACQQASGGERKPVTACLNLLAALRLTNTSGALAMPQLL
jgi:hypothetical protein